MGNMNENVIHDMVLHSRDPEDFEGTRVWKVLSFHDHLLRRFGFLQAIHLEPGTPIAPRLRKEADEVVFILEGTVDVSLKDLRRHSPSEKVEYRNQLRSGDLLLIPFGVRFECCALDHRSTLLLLATHEEEKLSSPPGPEER
jgi:mannose-6-phosphate isomerase-like protein (cupin superfamily)